MKGIDVLLVEDSLTDAELMIRALKRQRITQDVLHIRDGQEALDYLFGEGLYAGRPPENCPKLVMLDLKLPKVNGVEVVQRIKSEEKLKVIPVVMVTSSKEEKDILRSYQSGVNSFVSKPLTFDELLNVVSEIGCYWLLLNRSSENIN